MDAAASSTRQGWLRVHDVKGPPTHHMSCGQSPYTERGDWSQRFCILSDSEMLLLEREEIRPELLHELRSESCKGRILRRAISVPADSPIIVRPADVDTADAVLGGPRASWKIKREDLLVRLANECRSAP